MASGDESSTQVTTSAEHSASSTPKTDLQSDNARGPSRQDRIDKGVLTLPEPRRIRDRDHIRLVASRPCLVCGRLPSDPHHLRFAQGRALSRKVSDEFTVPLCRGHHRELHHCGDEAVWWERAGIDAMEIARALWRETHPLPIPCDREATSLASTPIRLQRPSRRNRIDSHPSKGRTAKIQAGSFG